MISKRTGRIFLGAIWFVDGILELLPGTAKTFDSFIVQAGSQAPGLLHPLIMGVAHFLAPQALVWNDALGILEMLLGLSLLLEVRPRTTLLFSVGLSVLIWIFGQGLGNPNPLWSGQATDLNSMPLYILAALLLLPEGSLSPLLGQRLLGLICLIDGLLMLEPSTAKSLPSLVEGNAQGEPAWFAQWLTWGGHWLKGDLVYLPGLLFVIIGLLLISQVAPRGGLGLLLLLSLPIWIFGQAFGGVLTGSATDLNSMPLYALVAFLVWPQSSEPFGRFRTQHR